MGADLEEEDDLKSLAIHQLLCPGYRSREFANCYADAGYALVTW